MATSSDYMKQLQQMSSQSSGSTYTASDFDSKYYDKLLELTQPKTDAEYQKAASDYYMPQYNAQMEAAQQAAEKEQLGYQNQLAQLERAMNKSRESINATQQQNISNLQNSMLRRGVARSSYAAQTEANARTGWAKALSDAEQSYQDNTNYIGQQQQLTTSQLAQTESRLKNDLAMNIANYEQTLRSNDKQAQMAAYQQLAAAYNAWRQTTEQLTADAAKFNSSSQQDMLQFLASMAQNQEQFDAEMAFKKEQAAKAASSSSGSGSGSYSSSAAKSASTNSNSSSSGTNWADFNKQISGNNGGSTGGNPWDNIYSAAANYATDETRRNLYGY